MPATLTDDLRLIESGFPCHQVGAETQRERGASSALPPLYYLHVWWARRPLTPSRAAILGATLSADTNTDEFLRALGIAKPVAHVPGGGKWVLVNETILKRVQWDNDRRHGTLPVDITVQNHFVKEIERRERCRQTLISLRSSVSSFAGEPVIDRWLADNPPFSADMLPMPAVVEVSRDVADAACVQDRIAFASSSAVKAAHGGVLNIDKEDLYGYDRAFTSVAPPASKRLVVLDPTAGGGSIPFEALRLGHDVISNELNPVATVIQYATLDYPRQFGPSLTTDIQKWGDKLVNYVGERMEAVTPFCELPEDQIQELKDHLRREPTLFKEYSGPEHDQTGLIYCRQIACPHCGGQAPLLNSFWLSKEAGDAWAVRLNVRSKAQVDIEPYRLPGAIGKELQAAFDLGTVNDGDGVCCHPTCKQVIDGEEIKAQARGESSHGTMCDRLFCIVSVRFQPKLKKDGTVDRYSSGERTGEVKTQKVRFFRTPTKRDFDAFALAEKTLKEKWNYFESLDLIPTELFPDGNDMRPRAYGMPRWCDLFTPRQLLGHLTLMEGLRECKPKILAELGPYRGKAVITYLQFAIDKGLDYNSRQTRWIYQRGQVSGTFGRHDFSFKWTFGEMVFAGPHTGPAWALSQIVDAYGGIAELVADAPNDASLRIVNGSGAKIHGVESNSVDLVVNDPPYYNNVMYAELADYFYVWQKRLLRDLYPGLFDAYLTDKQSEAVANPHRDGSAKSAKQQYERLMREMYTECYRVTKPDGRMVLMFTHKSQAGWETLTLALIDSGWTITATYPVESEFGNSMHIKDNASAESSIFLVCRKRDDTNIEPGLWKAFGGQGVQQRIIDAVREGLGEFEALHLRPVDTMVASYGRALRVLSEKWPVLDGDEPVSPLRAMNEASRVVAQHHIQKLTQGRLKVEDFTSEAAMTVTLYGICGLQPIRFDEVLNIARSLGISIDSRAAGYDAAGKTIGYATEATGRRASRSDDTVGYHAPLVRKGSNLRLALPEERNPKRLASPQHEWDILQGMILKYREGDVPVARAYLNEHAEGSQGKIIDLLRVWANEADDEKLRKEAETMLFGLIR
jgi:adenine-specific DNA methylase